MQKEYRLQYIFSITSLSMNYNATQEPQLHVRYGIVYDLYKIAQNKKP